MRQVSKPRKDRTTKGKGCEMQPWRSHVSYVVLWCLINLTYRLYSILCIQCMHVVVLLLTMDLNIEKEACCSEACGHARTQQIRGLNPLPNMRHKWETSSLTCRFWEALWCGTCHRNGILHLGSVNLLVLRGLDEDTLKIIEAKTMIYGIYGRVQLVS